MKLFKKLLASRQVRAALGVLDEANHTFDCAAFDLVRSHVEKMILAQPDRFAAIIRKGTSPRQWVYGAIANIAGDHLESGQHHIYRGVLDPLGIGEDLLRLFDAAVDELVRIGVLDDEYGDQQKVAIRENMRTVG